MTHREWIHQIADVIYAETKNAIFFEVYGEKSCEIGNGVFDVQTVEEFWELVVLFGENTDFSE